jgi:hypothetical protein
LFHFFPPRDIWKSQFQIFIIPFVNSTCYSFPKASQLPLIYRKIDILFFYVGFCFFFSCPGMGKAVSITGRGTLVKK